MKDTFSHEDPLTYLPRKPIQEFEKRRVIYDQQQPCDHLYVVIKGRVKITKTSEDGGQMVARIVSAEGLFGESALIGGLRRTERAVALDNVAVMSWSANEIEQQLERGPRLGLALSQFLVRLCMELENRFGNIAEHKTPERVMLALMQLADSLGTSMADGAVRVGSLTHQTIAEYVGTSREVVSFQLGRLRRLGLLCYSRQHMDIYTWPMQDMLREQGIAIGRARAAKSQAAG
jgi:CRP/FNR family transcriptional regulator, cyclic AMP receptor protein